MKSISILILGVALVVIRQPAFGAKPPTASELQELNVSLSNLFTAMKEGNVTVIEHYFSGQLYSEYRVLLEQNRDYPAFLRDFYRGAEFGVGNISPSTDGNIDVEMIIQLAGGSRSITRLQLRRFSGGDWKVANISRDPGARRHK